VATTRRNLLASASHDGSFRIWDTEKEKLLLTVRQDRSVWSVAFSPDGQALATGDSVGTVKLWDVEKLLAQGANK
jgi:WD40 repeat protein